MIQAKLFVLDQEILLLSTDMRYTRTIESQGRPSARIIGGKITLSFETREDGDEVLRWMVRGSDGSFPGENTMEKGKICFYENGFESQPSKTYEFNDAYLLNYKDSFNHHESVPLQTTITISPAIQNYGVEHIEPWNVSYVKPTDDEPFQAMENLEERILECYYTDLDGNKDAEPEIGDEVYLVLVTENKIGQTIDIDLSDHSKDFLYNGAILENDMLTGLSITQSTQKIKLEIVPPQPEPINAQ